MVSNIILRSMAKIAIKYENIVPHSGIFCTSILKVQSLSLLGLLAPAAKASPRCFL